MKVPELIELGRLGKQEPDGFFQVQGNATDLDLVNQLPEVHLIFDSNRVFFVTIKDKKTIGKRLYLRFLEDGVTEECQRSKQKIVAVDRDGLEDYLEDSPEDLFGFAAYFQDNRIGEIRDALINPMQAVLIVALDDGRELMVPDVPHYIASVDEEKQVVFFQNIEALLEICTSTS